MIARRLSDAQYFLLQSERCFDLARRESDDPSMRRRSGKPRSIALRLGVWWSASWTGWPPADGEGAR